MCHCRNNDILEKAFMALKPGPKHLMVFDSDDDPAFSWTLRCTKSGKGMAKI